MEKKKDMVHRGGGWAKMLHGDLLPHFFGRTCRMLDTRLLKYSSPHINPNMSN